MSISDWSPLDWTGFTLKTSAEPVGCRCLVWWLSRGGSQWEVAVTAMAAVSDE